MVRRSPQGAIELTLRSRFGLWRYLRWLAAQRYRWWHRRLMLLWLAAMLGALPLALAAGEFEGSESLLPGADFVCPWWTTIALISMVPLFILRWAPPPASLSRPATPWATMPQALLARLWRQETKLSALWPWTPVDGPARDMTFQLFWVFQSLKVSLDSSALAGKIWATWPAVIVNVVTFSVWMHLLVLQVDFKNIFEPVERDTEAVTPGQGPAPLFFGDQSFARGVAGLGEGFVAMLCLYAVLGFNVHTSWYMLKMSEAQTGDRRLTLIRISLWCGMQMMAVICSVSVRSMVILTLVLMAQPISANHAKEHTKALIVVYVGVCLVVLAMVSHGLVSKTHQGLRRVAPQPWEPGLIRGRRVRTRCWDLQLQICCP